MDDADPSELAEANAIANTMSPLEIARGLSSRNKRTARLSQMALRQSGARAVMVLSKEFYEKSAPPVSKDERRQARRRLLVCLSVSVGIGVVAYVARVSVPVAVYTSLYFGVMPVLTRFYLVHRDERPALRGLCELDDKRAIPVLIDALAMKTMMRWRIEKALGRLLTELTPEDSDILTRDRLRLLAANFWKGDSTFALGVLHAIEALGDGSFMELTRDVADPGHPESIRRRFARLGAHFPDPRLAPAAQRCLEIELARRGERMKADTLLRPSEPAATASLLRAAATSTPSNVDVLPRPAEAPEVQVSTLKGS